MNWFLIYIIWQCLFMWTSEKELPGLTYLTTGFDASKMLDINDISSGDQPRYLLLDFDQLSGKSYKLDVGVPNIESETFSIPNLLHVTELAMRSDLAVESVSTSYSDFIAQYFSSFSFDFDIGIPVSYVPITASLGFDTVTQQAYRLMQSTYQAVAISTSWLGLYSIQMAPSYLLNLHPVFNASLAKLTVNPTTEKQQSVYNELIATFGTHYTSSVIMGGVAHRYTFMTNQWIAASSQTSTANEISIGFSLGFEIPLGMTDISVGFNDIFGISFGHGWGSSTASQSAQFLSNSHAMTSIRPLLTGNFSRNEWFRRVVQRPAVVNRTLFPITYLLHAFPEQIVKHLQLTIDFYIQYHRFPKLNELTAQKQSKIIVEQNVPVPIFGTDIVGCGYDIMKLQSKGCLLNLTYTDNTIWSDVYNGHKPYKIPDGFFIQGGRDFFSASNTKLFDSHDSFIESSLYESTEDSHGFLGFGASSKRVETARRLAYIYKHNLRFAWSKQKVSWYTLAAATFPTPDLLPESQSALFGLPTTFDKHSLNSWKSFFDAFGTHYVVRSDFGGIVSADDFFESCLVNKYSSQWVKTQIRRSYWFFSKYEYDSFYTSSETREYRDSRISRVQVTGGAELLNPFELDKWIRTIKSRPRPITFHLKPIYTLLPVGSARRRAMEEATFFIRSQIVNETSMYIDRLQMIDSSLPLPKIQCSKSRRRRRQAIRNLSDPFNLTAARQALCPIIGYHGRECPQKIKTTGTGTGRTVSRSSTDLPTLPTGVGITIDSTTGMLLLPALNFTYNNKMIWQDTSINQTYRIPTEVKLIPLNTVTYNIRSFTSEIELIDALWLRRNGTGQWLGGEFAQINEAKEIFGRFFDRNNLVGINQKCIIHYKLEMKATKPTDMVLNKYAQRAIDQLSAPDSDNEIYDAFIDAWGTHIIVGSQIGGMIEQNILMPDCYFEPPNSNYFHVNFSNIVTDMQRELDYLSGNLCVSFFYFHYRKKEMEKRTGGDPTTGNNYRAWLDSIGFDPALLRIEKYVAWSDIVADPSVRQKLENAIMRRRENVLRQRIQEIRDIIQLTRRKKRIIMTCPKMGLMENIASLVRWFNTTSCTSSFWN